MPLGLSSNGPRDRILSWPEKNRMLNLGLNCFEIHLRFMAMNVVEIFMFQQQCFVCGVYCFCLFFNDFEAIFFIIFMPSLNFTTPYAYRGGVLSCLQNTIW